jgi:hypothetical protein
MNQRKKLVDSLGIAVGIFVIVTFFDLLRMKSNFNSHIFIENALLAIAAALGWIGFEELDRGGYRNVRRILRKCLIIWLVIWIISIFPSIYFKIDFVFYYSMYLFWLLLAVPFPVAVYLNHKQKKSGTEATVADAN